MPMMIRFLHVPGAGSAFQFTVALGQLQVVQHAAQDGHKM